MCLPLYTVCVVCVSVTVSLCQSVYMWWWGGCGGGSCWPACVVTCEQVRGQGRLICLPVRICVCVCRGRARVS